MPSHRNPEIWPEKPDALPSTSSPYVGVPVPLSNVTFIFDGASNTSVPPSMIALPLPITGSSICSVPPFVASSTPSLVMAVPGFERERAAGDVGIDRAVRLVDQRQSTVAGADLAGAGDGVVDVRQRAAAEPCQGLIAASPDKVTWPPPSSVTPSPIICSSV